MYDQLKVSSSKFKDVLSADDDLLFKEIASPSTAAHPPPSNVQWEVLVLLAAILVTLVHLCVWFIVLHT